MKIKLINPPSHFLTNEKVFPSLGLLKIGASLEQHGYNVSCVDLAGIYDWEPVLKQELQGITHVGITAVTPQIPEVVKICKYIKNNFDIKIIIGGPHVTMSYSSLKKGCERINASFDALLLLVDKVVIGYGDLAIIKAIEDDSNKIIDTELDQGLRVTNEIYEKLPMPARHLIDIESYKYEIDNKKATSLVCQLGCPYGCSFCGGRSSDTYRNIRARSVETVINEIDMLVKQYNYHGFMCYDSITEILTESKGFVKFDELSKTDKVATLDLSTNNIVFEVPKKIIKIPFNGNLIVVKNRMVDLATTPEHRMWVKLYGDNKYRHVTASDLIKEKKEFKFSQVANWQGIDYKTFSIPAYNTRYYGRGKGSIKELDGVRTFPAALWIKFMAWYLSEGSCYRPKIGNGGRGYRVCIKQSNSVNPHNVLEIKNILTKLKYNFSYSSDQFHIDSKELYEYLKQFGTSYRKHVPNEFKKMSSNLISLFIGTYIKGDGSISSVGQEVICSYSNRMRDDLQEMVIKSGKWAYVNNKFHRVQISKQKDLTINSKWGNQTDFSEINYCGYVHCVTVSSGIILVRRNGKCVWSGNCYDDELNINENRFNEFLERLIKYQKDNSVEFSFRGFTRADLLTETQAKLMYTAGFRWLLIGFESGSDKILFNMNKKTTVEQNTHAFEIARSAGLKIKALMSIGHPGESEETVNETKNWILKVKPDETDVTIITLYPGSPYYDQSVLVNNIWTYTSKSGDKLYSDDADFINTEFYYKSKEDRYLCHVYTDYLSKEKIVQCRNLLEKEIRSI